LISIRRVTKIRSFARSISITYNLRPAAQSGIILSASSWLNNAADWIFGAAITGVVGTLAWVALARSAAFIKRLRYREPISYRRSIADINYSELPGLRQRMEAVDQAVKKSTDTRGVVIAGPPGDGKTTTAIAYCIKNAKAFPIMWQLDATDEDRLCASYRDLAIALGNTPPADMQPTAVARAVIDQLSKTHGYLLVVDGADSPMTVATLRPKHNPPHQVVLITSIDSSWDQLGMRLAELPSLDVNEVTDYIRKACSDSDEEAIGIIVHLLAGYALGVGQAEAYIRSTGVSARQYLDALTSTEGPSILAHQSTTESHRPLHATIELTLSALHQSNPDALTLLAYISYMAPHPIPMATLTRLWQSGESKNELSLRESIASLRSYSLAKVDAATNTVRIHGLTLFLLRGLLNRRTAARYSAVMNVLAHAVPPDAYDVSKWSAMSVLTPHVQEVLTQATDTAKSTALLPQLSHYTGRYLWSVGRFVAARDLFSSAQFQLEDIGLTRSAKYASVLNDLAISMSDLGYPRFALDQHMRAIKTLEEIDSPDPADVAWTLTGLAAVARDLGYSGASGRILERVRLQVEHIPDPVEASEQSIWTETAYYSAWLDRGYDPTIAAEHLSKLTAKRMEKYGSDHPYIARSFHAEGRACLFAMNFQAARGLVERAVVLRGHLLGDRHPHTVKSQILLAKTFLASDEIKSASRLVAVLLDSSRYNEVSQFDIARIWWLKAAINPQNGVDEIIAARRALMEAVGTTAPILRQCRLLSPTSPDFVACPLI
jgi:hypothetical protein